MKAQHAEKQREAQDERRKAEERKRATRDAQRAARKARSTISTATRRKLQRQRPAFEFEDVLAKKVRPIDFDTFTSLAAASITQLSRTDHGLRFVLSNGLVLGVEHKQFGLLARLIPTQASPGFVSARVWLIRSDKIEEPAAAVIEERMWHLRQLYGLLFLVLTGDINLATDLLAKDDSDLEELIPQELRLCVWGLGLGSVWIDIVVKAAKKVYEKVKAAPEAALNAVSLVSREGWELAMRRVRANTRSVEAGATLAEAEAKKVQAQARQADAAADRDIEGAMQERLKTARTQIEVIQAMDEMIGRIEDPVLKKNTRNRLRAEIAGLRGTPAERILPPPS
jgi:hypothetical protein